MTSPTTVYDVIVIGAGIEGSSSAYNLAKRGKKVLLLEQFPLPHSRGSSHGQSRITRYAYEDEFYVRMMVDAFPMWAELQKESGADFFINCGVLDIRVADSPGSRKVSGALRAHNVPHEVLSPTELSRRFPNITAGGNSGAIWDPSGGILRADRALRAFQDVFKQFGGVIRDNEPVTSVTPGDIVTVKTQRSLYKSHSVVFATGAWTGRLCSSLGLELPLRPSRVIVLYWKAVENAEDHNSPKMPCFIDSRVEGAGAFHTYGLPASEYPALVKVCLHQGPECNPDERDKVENDDWVQEEVVRTVKSTFPNLEPSPSVREYCIYTNTPDNHPFIDRHPKYSNVIIAAGFSGHGFKLAPAVGKAVAELALKRNPTYNMNSFRIDRFSAKSNL